jgi:hypothetical protein
MESFWNRVQVELFNRRKWTTGIELATAIDDYIELWHNPRRRHSALGMHPIEVENTWLDAGTDLPTDRVTHEPRAAASPPLRLRLAPATAPTQPHSDPASRCPTTNHAA